MGVVLTVSGPVKYNVAYTKGISVAGTLSPAMNSFRHICLFWKFVFICFSNFFACFCGIFW